jgi:hypothetical protein
MERRMARSFASDGIRAQSSWALREIRDSLLCQFIRNLVIPLGPHDTAHHETAHQMPGDTQGGPQAFHLKWLKTSTDRTNGCGIPGRLGTLPLPLVRDIRYRK